MTKYRYGPQAAPQQAADVVLTRWCGAVLARSHAFKPKVQQLVEHQARNELTTISIRGREGSGKTTLATVLAHELHRALAARAATTHELRPYEDRHRQAMRRGYLIRVLTAKDLDNFEEILKTLPAQNRILVFDDASFIGHSTSNKVTNIKRQVTTVRHASGVDTKVVLIYNFHYSKGLDPYLRDTNYILQTGVSSQEARNMRELYEAEPENMPLLRAFQDFTRRMSRDGQVTINLGKGAGGRRVTYKHSDPFRLATWFDGERLSLLVYPAAGGPNAPDPLGVNECSTCAARTAGILLGAGSGCPADGKANRVDPRAIVRWLRQQWVRSDQLGSVLRAEYVHRYGWDPVHRLENAGIEMISRLEAAGVCTFEDLVVAHYGEDSAVGRHLLERPDRNHRQAVSQKKRDNFLATFGIDGLRPPAAPERKRPAENVKDLEALR